MNTWLDTFAAADGTAVVGAYRSDSGAAYANPSNVTANVGVIQGDSPYTTASGTTAWAVANVTLGLNDPVSCVLTWTGTSSAGTASLGVRAQADGSMYFARLRYDGTATYQYLNSSGVATTLGSVSIASALTASASYAITVCPTDLLHETYFQRASDGYYYNPVSAAYQSAKVALFGVNDAAIAAAGSPAFGVSYASTDSNPIKLTQVQGGPAILMAPDLGCSLAADRMAVLNVLPLQGGTAPISYALQRKTTGAFAAIGTIAPDYPFVDSSVSASTAYTYQVVATDANGLTATSAPVSVTTTATQTLQTIAPGNTGVSSWVNGLYPLPVDTAGSPLMLHGSRIVYSPLYGLYFGAGGVYDGTIGVPGNTYEINVYACRDLMNWEPHPGNPVCTNTINGVTYDQVVSQSLIEHPTDGNWYLIVRTHSSALGGAIFFLKSTTGPFGSYAYLAGPLQSSGYSHGDTNTFVDYDGSMWLLSGHYGGGANSIVVRIDPGMAGFDGVNSPVLNAQIEGAGIHRRGRQITYHGSYLTGWAWNPNFAVLCGGLGAAASTTPTNVAGCQVGNSSVFTTPATQMAAPAGAGPGTGAALDSNMPYGYGGSLTGSPSQYSGGTQYGIDPLASYGAQVQHVLKTTAGQYLWMGARHDSVGGPNAPYMWFPISFDSVGRPQVPFTASFVPQAWPTPRYQQMARRRRGS